MADQFFNREIKVTADGSHTLFLPGWNEHYHSVHGAIAESRHVFIDNGFERVARTKNNIHLLEVGFGTGLNALLTLARADALGCRVSYTAIEPYPLSEKEVRALNHGQLIEGGAFADAFAMMHSMSFGKEESIVKGFDFKKIKECLENIILKPDCFDLVYHDAFAPQFQPALWDEQAFGMLHAAMKPHSLIVTYSAKGSVKRALQACGFRLEHPAGPAGKREMTVAILVSCQRYFSRSKS